MNPIHAHILACQETEQRQKFALVQHARISLRDLPQKARTCGDSIVTASNNHLYPVGTKIEFKNDNTSVTSRQFFLEYECTNDKWWNSWKSGVVQAAKENCIVVLTSAPLNYVFTPASMEKLFSTRGRTTGTRAGANGNPAGFYARGKIVQMASLEKHCVDSFPLLPSPPDL